MCERSKHVLCVREFFLGDYLSKLLSLNGFMVFEEDGWYWIFGTKGIIKYNLRLASDILKALANPQRTSII